MTHRPLGGDAIVRIYPGTGPTVRDPIQSAMLDALLRVLHPRWTCSLEVPVHRPAPGVIDIVLDDQDSPTIVAGEAESDLRRIEAQTRWANLNAESLPSAELWSFAAAGGARRISKLLLLRSTERTRAIARQHAELLSAAYPARAADAYRALTTSEPWPDPAIVWVRLDREPTILRTPPRGVAIGR